MDGQHLNWTDKSDILIAVIALIISIVTTILTIWNYFYTKRQNKLNLRTTLINARQEMYFEIRNWADVVIRTMTEASTFCEYKPEKFGKDEMFKKFIQLNNDFSYLLDKGKLYLPNNNENSVGTHKPGAYQGIRQASLDKIAEFLHLSLALNYLDQTPNKQLQKKLNDKKREFVSEIQIVLEVRRIENEYKDLVKHFLDEINHK